LEGHTTPTRDFLGPSYFVPTKGPPEALRPFRTIHRSTRVKPRGIYADCEGLGSQRPQNLLSFFCPTPLAAYILVKVAGFEFLANACFIAPATIFSGAGRAFESEEH